MRPSADAASGHGALLPPDYPAMRDRAGRALGAAEALGDPPLIAASTAAVPRAPFVGGDPEARDALRRGRGAGRRDVRRRAGAAARLHWPTSPARSSTSTASTTPAATPNAGWPSRRRPGRPRSRRSHSGSRHRPADAGESRRGGASPRRCVRGGAAVRKRPGAGVESSQPRQRRAVRGRPRHRGQGGAGERRHHPRSGPQPRVHLRGRQPVLRPERARRARAGDRGS